MEKDPKNKIEIPRNSPVFRAHMGAKVMDLTWYNTTVYEFAPPYQDLDHVFVRYPDTHDKARTEYFNIFGNVALRDALKHHKYPLLLSQEPNDQDVEAYAEWVGKQMDQDLGELFGE